eukprot:696053-Prymnesium_polylepis.1
MRLPTSHRSRPIGAPPFADALSRAALHVGLSLALLTNAVQTPPAIAYSPFNEDQKIVAEAWKVTDREYVDRDFSGQDWFKTRQKMVSQKYASREEVRARPLATRSPRDSFAYVLAGHASRRTSRSVRC